MLSRYWIKNKNRIFGIKVLEVGCSQLIILILLSGLISCTKTDPEQAAQEPLVEDLNSTKIASDSLSPRQIKDIKRIYSVFSEVSSSSLKETMSYFDGNQNPSREIKRWLRMADAYERFTLNKHIEDA